MNWFFKQKLKKILSANSVFLNSLNSSNFKISNYTGPSKNPVKGLRAIYSDSYNRSIKLNYCIEGLKETKDNFDVEKDKYLLFHQFEVGCVLYLVFTDCAWTRIVGIIQFRNKNNLKEMMLLTGEQRVWENS